MSPLPSLTDYARVLQNPATAFTDPYLQALRPYVPGAGHHPSTGGNIITFRMVHPDGGIYAVRCLRRQVAGLNAHCAAIETFRGTAKPRIQAYLRQVWFLPRGIQVGPAIHPMVLMRWAEGLLLDDWARSHLQDPAMLRAGQAALATLARDLEGAGFIHGDLQHGNVLMAGSSPVLVDYDNAHPPGALNLARTTDGHRFYCHPRAATQDTALLDRFPHLVIHTALAALQARPALAGGGTLLRDRLLFLDSDFENPSSSTLFRALKRTPGVSGLAAALAEAARGPGSAVPTLEMFLRAANGPGVHAGMGLDRAMSSAELDRLERLNRPLHVASSPPQIPAHARTTPQDPAQARTSPRKAKSPRAPKAGAPASSRARPPQPRQVPTRPSPPPLPTPRTGRVAALGLAFLVLASAGVAWAGRVTRLPHPLPQAGPSEVVPGGVTALPLPTWTDPPPPPEDPFPAPAELIPAGVTVVEPAPEPGAPPAGATAAEALPPPVAVPTPATVPTSVAVPTPVTVQPPAPAPPRLLWDLPTPALRALLEPLAREAEAEWARRAGDLEARLRRIEATLETLPALPPDSVFPLRHEDGREVLASQAQLLAAYRQRRAQLRADLENGARPVRRLADLARDPGTDPDARQVSLRSLAGALPPGADWRLRHLLAARHPLP